MLAHVKATKPAPLPPSAANADWRRQISINPSLHGNTCSKQKSQDLAYIETSLKGLGSQTKQTPPPALNRRQASAFSTSPALNQRHASAFSTSPALNRRQASALSLFSHPLDTPTQHTACDFFIDWPYDGPAVTLKVRFEDHMCKNKLRKLHCAYNFVPESKGVQKASDKQEGVLLLQQCFS